MRFSLVIPIYNVAPYLQQCLESVLAQTCDDWEAVCVDDGSTDNSSALLSAYAAKDNRISIITQDNRGLSAARNAGLEVAKGDYVIFVDSDDWVESSMLSRLAEETDGSDIVCFACRRTDNEAFDTLAVEECIGWDYYNHHALEARKVPFVCVWQRCYQRQFLLENNLWFREGILHEDNEFTPRACFKAQSVKVVPNVLYNYRVRPNSIMTTRGRKSKESLILIGNELSNLFSHENGIDKTIIYRALTQYYQMAFINNTSEEDRYLLPQIDWHAYRRVSRTKLRHRLNYTALHLSPTLFRLLDK